MFSIRTQYIPHSKHSTSLIKINLLMLYETKVNVYFEKQKTYKRNLSTMWYFLTLKLVVHKVTLRSQSLTISVERR